MKKKHMIISFDSESWKEIKNLLGLGDDLKCKYCGIKITNKNIGGVSNPKEVFCGNGCCLLLHIIEQDSKQGDSE